MIPAREGYDVKFMEGRIDALPYEVVFGRLSANKAPIQSTGVESPISIRLDVDRKKQSDNPYRHK